MDEKGTVNSSYQDRGDHLKGDPRGADEPTYANDVPQDGRWLRSVVENSSEIVTIIDPEGILRYASPAWDRVLGYDPEKMAGTNVLDYVHPDDLPHVLEETEKTISEGGTTTSKAEYRFRHADGSWRWMESVGTYLLHDPEVEAIVVSSRDITERKEAEEHLREAEKKYRTLVERIPAITYIQEIGSNGDRHSESVYVSPQVIDVVGYTPEECTSTPDLWVKILHPDDREPVLAEDKRTNETGEPFVMEYRQFAKDGRLVWLRDEATLVRDEEGLPLYWLGVQTDITERKLTEKALMESEQRFRSSFQDASIGMALVATDGRWLQANPALCQIVGYSEEELLEKTFQEITHPDDLQADLDRVRRMLSGEIQTYQIEKRYLHKVGHVVWILLSVSLVHNEEGEPLYFVSQIQDISGRKEAEERLREAEERYRTLVETVPAVTYTDRAVGSYPDMAVYTSPQIEALTGYPVQEWLDPEKVLWEERLHPEDRAWVLAADERSRASGEPFSEEYRLLAKDGSVVWVRDEAVLLKNEAGEPLYWQGVLLDVTDRKEAEEALRRSEERLRSLADSAFEGILISDKGEILEANRALTNMLGYELHEMVGRSALEFIAPEHRELVRQKIASEDEEPYEIIGVRKDGTLLHLEVRGNAFSYRRRRVRVTAVRDITERKAFEERLRHQALHDSLTGLPNRQLFVDRLGQALVRTRRTKRKVAVLFMDLDEFKVVNDSLGHGVGDLLLTVVAQRLKRSLRPEDTLARFGGDEFTVLIDDVKSPEDAVRVAGRIEDELRRPFFLEGRELSVTGSIGIALGEARTNDSEDLLRNADIAMYQAKNEGSGYKVFDPIMYQRALGRLEMENELRRAIDREEFIVHYQPIVRLDGGTVWGVEALVRWNHPERGLLDPSEFVPIAEESGLVVPVGEEVLREACRRTKEWQENQPLIPPLVTCVNLSARQLSRPDLAETVERVLGETGMEGSRLTLDVTETVYVKVLEGNTATLDRLRIMGVRVSIDDFGRGYSSLSYLKRLPADHLKIDRSYVKGLGEDLEDTAIVRMVIELAHTLGMEVIAEGVESADQAELLAQMGCDMAQGFYFARPMPPEEASEFLAK
jgi:diguanylate cyclase (GGDEF)-like protein/PAS domain S-box-containing protein